MVTLPAEDAVRPFVLAGERGGGGGGEGDASSGPAVHWAPLGEHSPSLAMRGTVPWLGQNASLVGDKGAVVAVGIGADDEVRACARRRVANLSISARCRRFADRCVGSLAAV